MRQDRLPTISVVIACYNSERTIEKVLSSVAMQDYPKQKIEVIVADGGSKDKTLKIAKDLGAKIINVDPKKQNAEYNKGVGVNRAKNEILLLLDHDNILPHRSWFKKMVKPFAKHPEVVGVEPLRFYYDPKMSLLDRYFALLGGSDPVPYYFGKDSHLSWAFDKYNLWGKATDMGDYYLVKYSANKVPALGGNGAAIRRELLLKVARADPDNFFHIDVNADLIKKGYNTYALFKDSIIHLTNNKLIPFLLRRKYFIEMYHFEDQKRRRYSVFESKKDRLKLVYYVFISITVIKPLFDSIRGYIKIRDIAWFIHPVMCLAILFVYGWSILRLEVKRVLLGK